MSLDAAVGRIDQIMALEQQLLNPAAAAGASAQTTAAAGSSGASGSGGGSGSFASELAAAQAVGPASPGDAPAAVQRMLALAKSLIGAPYSKANHAGAFTESVAQIKQVGTDCSGLVSVLLGPSGAGVLSSPQTTDTLPSQPGILSGPGQYVTIWDRADAGDQSHVIIEMMGQWFESGGNSSYNPNGGITEMTSTQAQGELAGGGFVPLHPASL